MAYDQTIFRTGAGIFTQPKVSLYEQRLLRLAAKLRATAIATHISAAQSFNTGTPTEWKSYLATVEAQTKVGVATADQCRAATINGLWAAINGGVQLSFDSAYAFIKPMIGFMDEDRLARMEAFADTLIYDGAINL